MIGVVSLSQGVQCWLRLLGNTQNNETWCRPGSGFRVYFKSNVFLSCIYFFVYLYVCVSMCVYGCECLYTLVLVETGYRLPFPVVSLPYYSKTGSLTDPDAPCFQQARWPAIHCRIPVPTPTLLYAGVAGTHCHA